MCMFSSPSVPPAQDTSSVLAAQQKSADDAAKAERAKRAANGGSGAFSLLNPSTGYLGTSATLGTVQ